MKGEDRTEQWPGCAFVFVICEMWSLHALVYSGTPALMAEELSLNADALSKYSSVEARKELLNLGPQTMTPVER